MYVHSCYIFLQKKILDLEAQLSGAVENDQKYLKEIAALNAELEKEMYVFLNTVLALHSDLWVLYIKVVSCSNIHLKSCMIYFLINICIKIPSS